MMPKKRVLVVDDLAIYREPIAYALEAEGYRVVCAENGREALRAIESNLQPFDLLIVDYSMPVMDGITFLQFARTYQFYQSIPAIMLTDMADKEIVLQSRALGAKDYVLKTAFSLPNLLAKVKQYARHEEPSTGIVNVPEDNVIKTEQHSIAQKSASAPQNVLFIINKFIERNPIPETVKKVILLTESDDVAGSILSEAVKAEPLLASRVLRLANSSTYSRGDRRILDINEAISIVGFSAIRNFAVSAYFCSMGLHDLAEKDNHARRSMHVYAVARIMERLRSKTDVGPLAHLIGLCHELPEAVLQQTFPHEYKLAFSKLHKEGANFTDTIQELFGVSFIQIVETAFEKSGLVHEITDPIYSFYGRRTSISASSKDLSEVLAAAHALVSQVDYISPSLHSLDNPEMSTEIKQLILRPDYQLALDTIFQAEMDAAKSILLE